MSAIIFFFCIIGMRDSGWFTLVGFMYLLAIVYYGMLLQIVFFSNIDKLKAFLDILLRSGILITFVWVYFTGANFDTNAFSLDVFLRKFVIFANIHAGVAIGNLTTIILATLVSLRSSLDLSKLLGWEPPRQAVTKASPCTP
ncbi:hypothetical protein NKW55_05095 [Gluconobacter kondonii]|uniref:hypothetical protein n=1 Tax=Gluconobacter kondonii TaxID=941463 RepID=UPI0020A037B9|nr:hypothetical protein [Gluconobacter kondonii]MCP1235982.1 hypothetical protein [Gluconobacter kondonii]